MISGWPEVLAFVMELVAERKALNAELDKLRLKQKALERQLRDIPRGS